MLHTPISSMAANARRPGRAVILSLFLGSSSVPRSGSSRSSSPTAFTAPIPVGVTRALSKEAFSGFKSAGGEDDGAGASLPFSRRDMVGGHVPNPLCLLMHAANARHPQSGYHFQLA